MLIIRRLVLVVCVTGIMFLSIALRLGNVAPDDFVNAMDSTDRILWQIDSTNALIDKSKQALLAKKLTEAESYALAAWQKTITSGKATTQLLNVYLAQENTKNGDEIATLTSRLWPADTPTRAQLADYWVKRNDFSKVLPEWNALLIRNSKTHQQLFPILKQIVNNPETFNLLLPYMQQPLRDNSLGVKPLNQEK